MNNLFYLIPFFIVLLFVVPVFVKIRATYNLLENSGAMAIFVFGLKMFSLKFDVGLRGIKLYTNKGIEKIDYNMQNEEAVLMENFIIQIKRKTKLKLLQVHYNIGMDDAFQTAMVCGVVNTFFLILFTRIKCTKPTASLFLGDNPAFNERVVQFAGNIKISVSLFDIAYSFVNSVILTLKRKEGR